MTNHSIDDKRKPRRSPMAERVLETIQSQEYHGVEDAGAMLAALLLSIGVGSGVGRDAIYLSRRDLDAAKGKRAEVRYSTGGGAWLRVN